MEMRAVPSVAWKRMRRPPYSASSRIGSAASVAASKARPSSWIASAQISRSPAEARKHGLGLAAPVPREVEVTSRPVGRTAPERVEHRALEDEAITVGRLAQVEGQTVEEALRRVTMQDELKVLAALERPVEKAVMDRSGEVPALGAHDASVSR